MLSFKDSYIIHTYYIMYIKKKKEKKNTSTIYTKFGYMFRFRKSEKSEHSQLRPYAIMYKIYLICIISSFKNIVIIIIIIICHFMKERECEDSSLQFFSFCHIKNISCYAYTYIKKQALNYPLSILEVEKNHLKN